MKKTKILILAVSLLLLLVGCAKKTTMTEITTKKPVTYTGDKFAFHYNREDGKYNKWALWLWATGKDGAEFKFNGEDEYGAVATYYLSQFGKDLTEINFIVKSQGSWDQKDPDGDRKVVFSEFTKDSNDTYHIYLCSGEASIYKTADEGLAPRIQTLEFSTVHSINVIGNSEIKGVEILKDGTSYTSKMLDTPSKEVEVDLLDGENVDFESEYSAKVTFKKNDTVIEKGIGISKLYDTNEFGSAFNYSGELGAIYTKESTLFRVWSPVSSSITLRIYSNGTPLSVSSTLGSDEYDEYEMVKGEKGVFEYTLSGDQEGKYYTFVVTNSQYKDKEIVDPYALSAGVNGLRGMVVDFSKTDIDGWDSVSINEYDRKELTVWETHVADMTSSTTWRGSEANRKKFLGTIEVGTTYTEGGKTVKTGFDHVKELGVNAIQFVPVFDQANDEVNMTFNWGYNPLNYNVIEGGYSSNPYDGYVRIKEFKQVVMAYTNAGINVIMDVVYNHVNGATGSNFDVLMPGYYYRYNDNGSLSNGSGCGNETASERFMMHKFIVDSTEFLAKEYKLGGFRFDLMALHDLDTMADVAANLKTLNPYITVYGEPWTGGTTPLSSAKQASQANGNKYNGYGAFNDQMRDALIAGGMKGDGDGGWITYRKSSVSSYTMNRIKAGIQGFTFTDSTIISDPNKTVNYVTCHDNYTLYDRFTVYDSKHSDEEFTIDDLKQMSVLSNALVFTSQGTTFMLAGEEFLRSKQGDKNSYTSSYEVNELDYSLKIKYYDVFEKYQKLIEFKQSIDGLHLDALKASQIVVTCLEDNSAFYFTINDTLNGKTYMIAHANGLAGDNAKIDFSGYTLYYSTIRESLTLSSSTTILPFETIIGVKNS